MRISFLKSLTKRYLLALGIIALLSTTAYLNLMEMIKTQETSAAIMNISGRQRMLSQRIALLSLHLVNSKDPMQHDKFRLELQKSVDLLENSHLDLIRGNQNSKLPGQPSAQLKEIYYAAPHYLDAKVQKFINSTHTLLNTPKQRLSLQDRNLQYILNAAEGGFLSSLDLAVNQYQRESEAHIKSLKRLELLILFLTFLVLILIALFIFRPMVRLIFRETKQLTDANTVLQQLSSYDGLTGVANRRYFEAYLPEIWQQCTFQTRWLSVIMLDIDFFKNYNDTYGHQQGDNCLTEVATALKQALLHSGDLVARYGGEEFIVLLPDTDLQGALAVAEKLRTSVLQLKIKHAASQVANYVTISLGVASTLPSVSSAPETLIKQADMALYDAKKAGRNQVKARQ